MRELASILGQVTGDGEIAIERSRLSDIPGVIEIELFDFGIKKLVEHDSPNGQPKERFWLYATTRFAAPPAAGAETAAASPITVESPFAARKQQPVMEDRTLVKAGVGDDGKGS